MFSSIYSSKITEEQRGALIKIITDSLASIKTLSEGIDYLKMAKPYAHHDQGIRDIFNNDKKFQAKIKTILNDLSNKFKGDKNYSEWEKCVEKIFPKEASKK